MIKVENLKKVFRSEDIEIETHRIADGFWLGAMADFADCQDQSGGCVAERVKLRVRKEKAFRPKTVKQ